MEDETRPTIMEVYLDNFEYNINKIKEYLNYNVEIMPVIKANAYGTYINTCIDILNKFNIVAVAIVDEGVKLRRLGYKKDIFVLNPAYVDEIDKIIDNDLIVSLSSDSFLSAIEKRNENIRVHLEIGTGMGRTGINPARVEEYTNRIRNIKNIFVEGIYTHLSSADVDFDYTEKQLKSFDKSIIDAENVLGKIRYKHASASNGILNFKNHKYNLVRPGMIMYGYESYEGALDKIDLKPVCRLKTKITYLKEVGENVSIGYSRSFITNKKTMVATIPIGYADGFKRSLSNKGTVVINSMKANVIGNVCMDGCMIDVTGIPNVKVGDDVYIWDNELQTLEEISSLAGTINYEMISTISERVPRKFIRMEN